MRFWIGLFVSVALVTGLFLAEREADATTDGFDGVASCYGYGDELGGKLTASGEVFDPESRTVAHNSLPFGTPVVFSYAGRSVDVTVNDRGPGIPGREWDLSCGAMAALGLPPGVYVLGVSVLA